MYKYEERLTSLIRRIIGCCGDITHSETACIECKNRIAKCSRLVLKAQMPLFYYIKLIRILMEENKKV